MASWGYTLASLCSACYLSPGAQALLNLPIPKPGQIPLAMFFPSDPPGLLGNGEHQTIVIFKINQMTQPLGVKSIVLNIYDYPFVCVPDNVQPCSHLTVNRSESHKLVCLCDCVLI